MVAAVLVGGCTSTASAPPRTPPPATVTEEIQARGLDPAAVVVPFEVDGEMRAWALEHVGLEGSPRERVERLLTLLVSPQPLGMTYERGANHTALTAFRERKANCLAFAFLFVGLARALEVPVGFLLVPEVESFRRDDDLVVVSEHATAVFGEGPDRRVLEFTLGPTLDYRRALLISDLTATALYYSNRGAAALQRDDAATAINELETAVVLQPALGQAWGNLGVAQRRAGNLDAAESAYLQALALDPQAASVYQNLAVLQRLRGADEGQVLAMLARVDELGSQNPFSYLSLGDLALEIGRLAEAGRFYREALRRAPLKAEVVAAYGLWQVANGDLRGARRRLRQAQDLDPRAPRVEALSARLAARAKAS